MLGVAHVWIANNSESIDSTMLPSVETCIHKQWTWLNKYKMPIRLTIEHINKLLVYDSQVIGWALPTRETIGGHLLSYKVICNGIKVGMPSCCLSFKFCLQVCKEYDKKDNTCDITF